MPNPLQLLNPVHDLESVRRDVDRLFEHFFGRRSAWPQMVEPAIDSFIEGDKLIVRAQLPGADPKNVDVTISGNLLTIRASREELSEKQERDFLHQEISYGRFERSIALPPGTSGEGVKASFRNGVLELTIPVPKELSTRKVEIDAGDGAATARRPDEKQK